MTGALYPGTFDPITNGHHDLVRRAVDIFGRVLVAIAANPGKAPLFTVDERVELAREVLRDIPNVEVTGYTGLTVDFARQHGETEFRERSLEETGLRPLHGPALERDGQHPESKQRKKENRHHLPPRRRGGLERPPDLEEPRDDCRRNEDTRDDPGDSHGDQ